MDPEKWPFWRGMEAATLQGTTQVCWCWLTHAIPSLGLVYLPTGKDRALHSLSKFTAMTIEEEDEEITHEESKMLRERFFEGQHFGWCFLRCEAFSKTLDFASGTLARECSLSDLWIMKSLICLCFHLCFFCGHWQWDADSLNFWKCYISISWSWWIFETIDTCRVPYQAVYICISFSRFWLMGPIVPLIRKWGAQQITRCLILTWNAVERPRNVFEMSDGEGYTRLFV